jgi:hypothetical protein
MNPMAKVNKAAIQIHALLAAMVAHPWLNQPVMARHSICPLYSGYLRL